MPRAASAAYTVGGASTTDSAATESSIRASSAVATSARSGMLRTPPRARRSSIVRSCCFSSTCRTLRDSGFARAALRLSIDTSGAASVTSAATSPGVSTSGPDVPSRVFPDASA